MVIFIIFFVTHRLPLTREDAVKVIVDNLGESDAVVSSTGLLSRELFEYRNATSGNHEKDFLTIGSKGHASSIALGIATSKPYRQVSIFTFFTRFKENFEEDSPCHLPFLSPLSKFFSLKRKFAP